MSSITTAISTRFTAPSTELNNTVPAASGWILQGGKLSTILRAPFTFWRGITPLNRIVRRRLQRVLCLAAFVSSVLTTDAAEAQTVAEEIIDRLLGGSTEKKNRLPEFKAGSERDYIRFSGHINKGLLVHDDGNVPLDYRFVDNGSSPTRARIEIYSEVGDQMAFGGLFEGQWNPYSTTSVNQTNRGDYDWQSTQLRKAEGWIGDNKDTNRVGRFWFGQGSMASDGTAEVDLSGTGVVSYSGIGDLAGGQLFRVAGTNALSTVSINDAYANLDGFGRELRVRYDTPTFSGFKLSTSYGTDVVPTATGKPAWDIAARYAYDQGGTRLAAALAFGDSGDVPWVVSGSASVLLPSNFNFSVALAFDQPRTGSARVFYGKVGYIAHLIEAGATAFSVDAYYGRNFNTAGSRSTAFGVQAVQNLDDWRTELYLGLNHYRFSEIATKYEDALSILAGARIKF